MPNGVNASIDDGCFWLAGMVSAPFTTSGNRMGVNADKKIQMPAGRTAIAGAGNDRMPNIEIEFDSQFPLPSLSPT